ncbi:sensor histidine kinase [Arcicella rosea]|nr:histidine kinase [Arcicella rosea]
MFYLRFFFLIDSLNATRPLPTGLSNFIINIIFFYSLVYYGLPKLLLKKLIECLFLVIVLYCLMILINYFTVWSYLKFGGQATQTTENILLVNNGFFVAFLGKRASFYFLFDTFFELLFPLVLKLGKSFYEAHIKTITLERDKSVLELNRLRNQINPHFFFNNLNSIYSLVLKQDERASTALLKLSNLMRHTLYEADTEKTPLSQEITLITDYLSLAKIRYGSRVIISYEEENNDDGFIPTMLLLSFVENAFKHGVEEEISNNKAWVKVIINANDGILVAEFENSKPKVQAKAKIGGIGLTNSKKRLDLLYPNSHQLDILEKVDSYYAKISLKF